MGLLNSRWVYILPLCVQAAEAVQLVQRKQLEVLVDDLNNRFINRGVNLITFASA